jgi:thioredoxin reductase (NADPH)
MISEDMVRAFPLFAALPTEHIRRIATRAADIRLREGDWAAREGEAGAFYALLEGRLEISKMVAGAQQRLTIREAGEYFGEVPLLLGTPFIASFRALAPCRLLRISAGDFNVLLQASTAIRDEMAAALLARVSGIETATSAPQHLPLVVGNFLDSACHDLREFLNRNFVEFEWLDPSSDVDRPCIPPAILEANNYPVLRTPDGALLCQPTLRAAAIAVGLNTEPDAPHYDVVIVGGGPGGLAAAVYGASEGLHTLMIEATAPGGQTGTTSRIENYLGFPIGVSGDELASRAFEQAKRFGAEIVVTRRVCSIEPGPDVHTICLEDGVQITARAVVLTVGVTYRALRVPGIEPFVGAGVFYGAARTEAISTHGRTIYLIGGGNSAGQAAMFFSDYAVRVTLLVRGPSLADSMSQYLIDQLDTRDNIVVRTCAEMVGVSGASHLEEIEIRDNNSDTVKRVTADAVFIFIGADAYTEWLPESVARDNRGYVLTGAAIPPERVNPAIDREPYFLETSMPGIFAAGDVRHNSIKRCAAAVGEGSMAIALIHQYLASRSSVERVVSAVG